MALLGATALLLVGCTGERPYFAEDGERPADDFVGDPAVRPADELGPDGTAQDG